ncbi:MAG: glycyl-radical enzyme activating protein [Gammaproteobacteria bacterium]|nr:glycyl-radical enzyme activating protein [Gammaproteobacteria bacterium]
MTTYPQVFAIQHFCVHDGPGIRSVVFFKGCPLRCSWCQNPESWRLEAELGHKRRRCIECGTCLKTCPTGAMKAPGQWAPETCNQCFRCVASCPSGALTRFGEPRTAADVHAELAKEFALYRQSGGGVTFSGGEASLFPEYLVSLLDPLRADGIHVAMETCGLFRFRHLRPLDELLADGDAWCAFESQVLWKAIGALDLVLFDLKLMDRARHREHCGTDNLPIHDNFRLLAGLVHAGRGPQLWPRLPLVPGITDDEDNVRAVARFVRQAGLGAITLLPYHNLGVEKFDWLRRPEAFSAATLAEERLLQARQLVEDEGLRCYQPGDEDYGPLILR